MSGMDAQDDELHEALRDAAEILRTLGRAAMDVFGDAPVTSDELTPEIARALGLIEGAAVALHVTPVVLLDDHALEF